MVLLLTLVMFLSFMAIIILPLISPFLWLQLGLINMNCELIDSDILMEQLKVLKAINVDGVMIDCWWGIVEYAPQQYNWDGYKKLFHIVRDLQLKLQVLSTFSCICHSKFWSSLGAFRNNCIN